MYKCAVSEALQYTFIHTVKNPLSRTLKVNLVLVFLKTARGYALLTQKTTKKLNINYAEAIWP